MRSKPLAMFLSVFAVAVLSAQEPPPQPEPPGQGPAAARPGVTPPGAEPQPYEKVITKDARSTKGIFTVHQIKDRYYYEIPKDALDKVFLWNTQIAKTVDGAGSGGQELSDRVVRWELNGTKVHLRYITYNVVADPKTPIAQAVTAANNDTIIMTFPVAAFKDGDPCQVRGCSAVSRDQRPPAARGDAMALASFRALSSQTSERSCRDLTRGAPEPQSAPAPVPGGGPRTGSRDGN